MHPTAPHSSHPPTRPALLALHDSTASMLALMWMASAIERSAPEALSQLVQQGMSPELLEQVRSMPLGEAVRFAQSAPGLGIAVDPCTMGKHLQRMALARRDREIMEYLVQHGASPRLLTHLFTLAQSDARRLRKTLAPEICAGGRPRIPNDDVREAIEARWSELQDQEPCMRRRIQRLHQSFPEWLIASLELVVLPLHAQAS
jgi:hypothetical protein